MARITDICSDIAIKLTAATSRGEKVHTQFLVASHSNENMSECGENQSSLRRPKALRGNSQQAGLPQEAQRIEAGGMVDRSEFATFMGELNALRLRMMTVSFYERVEEVSRQIADATESGDELGSEEVSDNDQALKSIRDAIANAVLLLPYHGAGARHAR
ncbi:hypothetical protein HYPDE_29118 [Hyphomicrobium denitrificans 1NES1]|uniref:Uncharacterized protein n=1 Tax=Hyphomicrobium denitrificans 1NES1 TaxID=670307 RepID=N0B5N4_9HYPH|nr:hypothetical protein [Hyphomicrobium denitrificans]AGK57502.1 hypothetical protein HYPDE_29118 [Hyphomicrobium denitrificans 1NES1]